MIVLGVFLTASNHGAGKSWKPSATVDPGVCWAMILTEFPTSPLLLDESEVWGKIWIHVTGMGLSRKIQAS